MTTTATTVEAPGDAELISAVRGGDVDAYGELFERHVAAARRLARQLVTPAEADDLVSESFVKVLTVLQRGGGPDVAFRAYLLTALRRLHVDRIRATSKLHTTDDMEAFDPGVPFQDTAIEGFESEAAAKAFASLPERWQLVLWHTEVEGSKPAEVAPLLGMTPNSVSALAYRAREGLRQAFINQHALDVDSDTCSWTHQHLGGYIRSGLSRRDSSKVEAHLQDCRKCMAIYLELTEVNDNLAGILAPLLLGGLASGYLAATTGATTTVAGGLVALLDRLKDTVASNAGTTAAAGVAAATAVAGGFFLVSQGGDPAPPQPPAAAEAPSDPAPADPAPSEPPAADSPAAPPQTTAPGDTPDAPPPPPATSGPSSAPTTSPGTEPTDEPTTSSSDAPNDPPPAEGPTPDPPPDDEPPDEPPAQDPPPAADLAVGAYLVTGDPPVAARRPAPGGAPTQSAVAEVSGVTGPATLTVSADRHVSLLATDDSDCETVTVGDDSITCTVTHDASVWFRTLAPQGVRLTFTADSDARDADTSNNNAAVTVPGIVAGIR